MCVGCWLTYYLAMYQPGTVGKYGKSSRLALSTAMLDFGSHVVRFESVLPLTTFFSLVPRGAVNIARLL